MPILHTVTFIWWISKYTSFEDLCRYSCHDGCYDASLALPGQKHNLPVPTCSNHKSRIFSMSSEFFILYSASGSILIDRWSQVTPKKTPQPPFELIQLQGQWCQHDRELRGGVFAKVKGWQALPVLIDWMVFFWAGWSGGHPKCWCWEPSQWHRTAACCGATTGHGNRDYRHAHEAPDAAGWCWWVAELGPNGEVLGRIWTRLIAQWCKSYISFRELGVVL